MGQECFYRENRKDREEREVLLTERVTADGGQMLFRIRPMNQRENEDIWKRCGEEMKFTFGGVELLDEFDEV